jgi:hypothetical protein
MTCSLVWYPSLTRSQACRHAGGRTQGQAGTLRLVQQFMALVDHHLQFGIVAARCLRVERVRATGIATLLNHTKVTDGPNSFGGIRASTNTNKQAHAYTH